MTARWGTCDSTSGGHVTARRGRYQRKRNLESSNETQHLQSTGYFKSKARGHCDSTLRDQLRLKSKRKVKIEMLKATY